MATESTNQASLLTLAREVLHELKGLRGLDSGSASLRSAVLLFEKKILPELEHPKRLPVFLAIQGGTNTGKSFLFNAVVGRLLSPSTVLAAATKHALFYAHEDLRTLLFEPSVLPGLECRELVDPKELLSEGTGGDLAFFRFHDDPAFARLVVIDSPDSDSDLGSNAARAAAIAAISDATLHVTTAQKYRDRVLLEELRSLLDLKGQVTVVLNLVEEGIVADTILDDLRRALGERGKGLLAVHLPPSRARHPEDELRPLVESAIVSRLRLLDPAEVKPRVLNASIRAALAHARACLAECSRESATKEEILAFAREGGKEARREYAAKSSLAFPEETIAIRRVLGLTELLPRILGAEELARVSRPLGTLAAIVGRGKETLTRVLVRLSRGDEGVVESTPAALAEYAAARNAADEEQALRLVEPLYLRVESLVRERAESSILARELLRRTIAPAGATGFSTRWRSTHSAAIAETKATGAEILPALEAGLGAHPRGVKALSFGAIAFKLALGFGVAWALPPSEGILAFLSPLEWLTFFLGYFAAAWGLCLAACLLLRKRGTLRRARERAFAEALERAFEAPLERTLEEILDSGRLTRLTQLHSRMAAHPDLPSESSLPRPLKEPDRAHPSPGGDSGGAA